MRRSHARGIVISMHFRRHIASRPGERDAAADDAAAPFRPRYAVYYAPPCASSWWQFGSAWLGYDAITGAQPARPSAAGVSPEEVAQWTAGARRYGWHATLKAPFRLAERYEPGDLYREAARVAAGLPRVHLGALTAVEMDDFVALRLRNDSRAMDLVACECTRRFDYLRGPGTAAELERRRDAGLTPRQLRLLERWGYPHCMEEFRFHMTLTDRVAPAQRARIIAALEPHVAALNEAPLRVDALCIFRQPAPDAPFALMRRYGFNGEVDLYRHE